MAIKLHELAELSHRMHDGITASAQSYYSFLKASAWLYKYPYSDQLLIYAQRPTAVAVAPIELWNEHFNRWVRKGVRGIALFDESNEHRIRYVFDYRDTWPIDGDSSNKLQLWSAPQGYEKRIISELCESFELDPSVSDPYRIILDIVQNNSEPYAASLKSLSAGSSLDRLSPDELLPKMNSLLFYGVLICVGTRLSMNTEQYLSALEGVTEFDTPAVADELGQAISDISEMILRQIERSSKKISLEIANSIENVYNIGDNNERRSDDHGREEGFEIHEVQGLSGGDQEPGDHLSSGGGLFGSELYESEERGDLRNVRRAQEEVPEGEPSRNLQQPAAGGSAPLSSGGDRPTGLGDDGRSSEQDGSSGRRDGRAENEKSSRMGAEDGEHQEPSDGDSEPGAHLQLSFLKSEEQQISDMKAEGRHPSAFHISQEDFDHELIRHGSGVVDGKMRIYRFYESNPSKDASIAFLKKEYGIGGHSHTYLDGTRGSVDYDGKGIRFSIYNYNDAERISGQRECLYKWPQVDTRLRFLISQDRYLSEKERAYLPEYDRKLRERDERLAEERRKSIERFEAIMGISKEQKPGEDTRYSYAIHDTVYINGLECEVLDVSADTVIINNPLFPILVQPPITKAEFEDKLRADRRNDHLIVSESSAVDDSMLAYAKKLINEYCQDEFEEDADFGDLSSIGIAYTTVGDDELPTQVNIDLKGFSVDRFIADILVERRQYDSLEDLISHELEVLDFNELTDYTDDQLEEVRSKLAEMESENAIDAYEAEHGSGGHLAFHKTERILPAAPLSPEFQPVVTVVFSENSELHEGQVLSLFEANALFGRLDAEHTGPGYDKTHFRIDCTYKGDSMTYDGRQDFGDGDGTLLNHIHATNLDREFTEYLEMHNNLSVLERDAASRLEDKGLSEAERSELITTLVYVGNSRERLNLGLYDIGEPPISETKLKSFTDVSGAEAKPSGVHIGEVIRHEGRSYRIERIDELSGDVSMFDIASAQELGIPLNRVEKVHTVMQWLDEMAVSEPKQDFGVLDHTASAIDNFRITDMNLGVGGAKAKFRMNMEAIRTLKQIELERRNATAEEQEILAKYVGWGGLPDAFDESKLNWATEFKELREALSNDEYEAARASTLNAHFTSPIVIKAMYDVLLKMGIRTGNILEPSCGIGNFFGMLPSEMSGSRLYGVELDSITGRIAKQLYPKASIAIQGFETYELPDSFFDAAIGNVPFGDYSLIDKRYDKHHFLIHDYFFAKALDKVRPGGIIAFVTSSGTLDKKNPSVRKYIAQRAELLGAVRLPNNAFSANAGTSVVADLLFLQKRDRQIEIEPEWVSLGTTKDGFTVNQYFVDHPDMILGDLAFDSTQYGRQEVTVVPIDGAVLSEQLDGAVSHIAGKYEPAELSADDVGDLATEAAHIPADPNTRNFSFTVVDGDIYFRENSIMTRQELSQTARKRILGMIGIRDSVRKVIELQLDDHPDHEIEQEQVRLNKLYDDYTVSYGVIGSRANRLAFQADSSYSLLSSLENLDENGKLISKADIFSKRTIRKRVEITHCDTAMEALTVSISEKACVDIDYMANLTGKEPHELEKELEGVIFRDIRIPLQAASEMLERFDIKRFPLVTADEYLSGNVRDKLRSVERLYEAFSASAESNPNIVEALKVHKDALEGVQPQKLTASEIDVRLGATWIPPDYVRDFVYHLMQTPRYLRPYIKVRYSEVTGDWNVEGKSYDSRNVNANLTYGTSRANAYKIVEDALNLRDTRVFDTVTDSDGRERRVLNRHETITAQQKQQAIKDAFREWIWQDPERRDKLCNIYNERFNSTRPRTYDGSSIRFDGMNPEISLRPHQQNAIARVLYGGNSLLAHVVGAGKTYEMAAAAMEMKRLGLCQKSLFVVPNHLTEQWASEFLQLYPAANLLVATKKDFETKNRKKFCARIATGDYDAIIIGHSQFEKIPLSIERQEQQLREQIDEIANGIMEAKLVRAERFTIKQMEKAKKQLETKLKKLTDQSRKDDVVTFEELGVDRLFVDEAHSFKNLFLYTKMRNVSGLAQTEAMKSSDMFMKCRYMDHITGSKGTVFATGTPISNSMTEMYTMQRYLQYGALERNGLTHFDAWASTFGETVTQVELAPEGNGYRSKTRFARFFNLPELVTMFSEIADVQTADMLKLPVPECEYHDVVITPSEFQKGMIASFSERADKVRNGMVSPSEDNMLKITNDGRKLALDQRLIDPLLPDEENSKVNACVSRVFDIWQRTGENKSTQLVFCDLSTPSPDKFNVYDDMKAKLIEMGIPKDEIAFIHDANTEERKAELFRKVNAGSVRILLGSTAKMGAGTNVQKRLIAEHHLDVPWRPSDIEQREGRILRQGNNNPKVDIFRYVTESTFDSYMWQTIENKQRFISQIMTSKSPVRSCEDIDEAALSYAEVKALAAGNPAIKEKMELDVQVARLRSLKSTYLAQKYALEDRIAKQYPAQIKALECEIEALNHDVEIYNKSRFAEFPGMTIDGEVLAEKKDAGSRILELCQNLKSYTPTEIGSYRGFRLLLGYNTHSKAFEATLQGASSHIVQLESSVYGNIQRIDNLLAGIEKRLSLKRSMLEETHKQCSNAKEELGKPFPYEEELASKSARLAELDAALNLGEAENEGTLLDDDEPGQNGSLGDRLASAKEDARSDSDKGSVSPKPLPTL